MNAVRDYYARLGITLLRAAGNEAPARCFASPDTHRHDDRHPSVSVNLASGAWLCHGCGARGGAYDAALLRGHSPRGAMDLLISCGLAEPRRTDLPRRARQKPARRSHVDHGAAPPKELDIPDTAVAAWAERLAQSSSLLARLEAERAISPGTLARFEIGLDGRRITMPVREADGRLQGVVRWLPFDRRGAPKMLALPGSRRKLFPAPEHLPAGPILLCEGEPDALAAHTAGFVAVAIPGVAAWRPAWATRFTGRAVTAVMDCDDEGRACARRVALDLRGAGITAQVVDLDPERDDGYDLTDHLLAGRSIDEL